MASMRVGCGCVSPRICVQAFFSVIFRMVGRGGLQDLGESRGMILGVWDEPHFRCNGHPTLDSC